MNKDTVVIRVTPEYKRKLLILAAEKRKSQKELVLKAMEKTYGIKEEN